MSFYGIETWFIKLHKNYLNNISVVYHKDIKSICCRNSYDNNHRCHEYARLPTFRHFLARKFICYVHRLFTLKNPCLMILKHYLKYSFVSRISLETFFSENHQVNNVFDNPLCSILRQIDFVQRTEPRSVRYKPG